MSQHGGRDGCILVGHLGEVLGEEGIFESMSGSQGTAFIPTDVDRTTSEHIPTYGHGAINNNISCHSWHLHALHSHPVRHTQLFHSISKETETESVICLKL